MFPHNTGYLVSLECVGTDACKCMPTLVRGYSECGFIGYRDVVEIANQFLDIIDADFAGRILHEVFHDLFGQIDIEVFAR